MLAAIVVVGAFKAVAPSDVCVVQEGGPLDGRGISEVRQPSGGVSFIGVFNTQHCFPATQRNYVVVLVSIAAVATNAYVLLTAWLAARARRGGPWRVDTVVDSDGSLRVVLVRDGEPHVRTVRALPGDMDSVELAAELRLAREDAQLQADELNR